MLNATRRKKPTTIAPASVAWSRSRSVGRRPEVRSRHRPCIAPAGLNGLASKPDPLSGHMTGGTSVPGTSRTFGRWRRRFLARLRLDPTGSVWTRPPLSGIASPENGAMRPGMPDRGLADAARGDAHDRPVSPNSGRRTPTQPFDRQTTLVAATGLRDQQHAAAILAAASSGVAVVVSITRSSGWSGSVSSKVNISRRRATSTSFP